MLSTTWRSYEDMRGHLIHAFKEIGGEEFSNAVIGDTIQKVFDTGAGDKILAGGA